MSIYRSAAGAAARRTAKKVASASLHLGAKGSKSLGRGGMNVARRVVHSRAMRSAPMRSVGKGLKRTGYAAGGIGVAGAMMSHDRNKQISGRQSMYEH